MPIVSPIIKVMALILAGSFILSPIPQPQPQAGKITNKISKIIIDKSKDKVNPNPNKKKLPIIAGYKPGKNPLPEGRTAKQNYEEAWKLLKNELGWK